MNSIIWMIENNKDALMSIPAEVKMILVGLIALSIVLGIVKKAAKLIKLAAWAGIIYFALTYFGVL